MKETDLKNLKVAEKVKRTYRLSENTLTEMLEIQEMYKERTGVKLSFGQIIEKAIYEEWKDSTRKEF